MVAADVAGLLNWNANSWFETDIVDLYRTMLVQSSPDKARFAKAFKRLFGDHIDALQNVL